MSALIFLAISSRVNINECTHSLTAGVTLVEDPGKLDLSFWLDYFQRTKSDAVCLSVGGCVAWPAMRPRCGHSVWVVRTTRSVVFWLQENLIETSGPMIEIKPEVEAKLRELAAVKGLSIDELLKSFVSASIDVPYLRSPNGDPNENA